MTTLLVFIHGFLGSEESFLNFPLDIKLKLSTIGSLVNPVDIKVYPKYDTNGNNKKQGFINNPSLHHFNFDLLVTWLLQNVKTTHKHTILLSHSMGGLLAVDAYIELQSHADIHHLVNITALISFDAPFFGIRTTSVAITGIVKAKSVLRNGAELYNSLTRRQEHRQDTSINTVSGNESGKWIAGLAIASAAAILYKTGLSSVITQVASGMASNIAEHARHHMEFLYPLVSSTRDMHERFKVLEDAVKNKRIIFQGFHLYKVVDGNVIQFCNAPSIEYQDFFTKVDSVYLDEIDAHMNMFDAINGEHYIELVTKTVDAIQRVLTL